MNRQNLFLLTALAGLLTASGCANARYVQTDQNSGVVAMPSNTNCWPTYYRDHAEALMRQKCPAGYEIVREEEAVVGQTAHADTHTETSPTPTLNFGGESDKKDGSSTFAGLAVPLTPTHEKKQQTTNTTNLTEWRIYYRVKSASPPAPAAQLASPSPPAPRG